MHTLLKRIQNITRSPVVEEVRHQKRASSAGLWAVASFDVRYLQSIESAPLRASITCVSCSLTVRECSCRSGSLGICLSNLTTEEKKIDCALSPNSEEMQAGGIILGWFLDSHALTSNPTVDFEFLLAAGAHIWGRENPLCGIGNPRQMSTSPFIAKLLQSLGEIFIYFDLYF